MTSVATRRLGCQPCLWCVLLLMWLNKARAKDSADLSHGISFQLWREGPLPRTLNDPVLTLLRRLDWQAQRRVSPSTGKRSRDGFPANKPSNLYGSLPTPFADSMCLSGVLSTCDFWNLWHGPEGVTETCQLLQAFQLCIRRETQTCLDPDVKLLMTSLRHLTTGLQTNGDCLDVEPISDEPVMIEELPEVCVPGPAWQCTLTFTDDLADAGNTCKALVDFRDCLQGETRVCGYGGARFLMDGIRGLTWAYERSRLCPRASTGTQYN